MDCLLNFLLKNAECHRASRMVSFLLEGRSPQDNDPKLLFATICNEYLKQKVKPDFDRHIESYGWKNAKLNNRYWFVKGKLQVPYVKTAKLARAIKDADMYILKHADDTKRPEKRQEVEQDPSQKDTGCRSQGGKADATNGIGGKKRKSIAEGRKYDEHKKSKKKQPEHAPINDTSQYNDGDASTEKEEEEEADDKKNAPDESGGMCADGHDSDDEHAWNQQHSIMQDFNNT